MKVYRALTPQALGGPAGSRVPFILTPTIANATTQSLTQVIMAYLNVPGGVMGANGCIDIDSVFGVTGSAGTWTLNVRIVAGTSAGTTGGTSLSSTAFTAGNNGRAAFKLFNKGAQNSQGFFSTNPLAGFTQTSNGIQTASIDTSAAFTISLNALVANASDLVTYHTSDFVLKYSP